MSESAMKVLYILITLYVIVTILFMGFLVAAPFVLAFKNQPAHTIYYAGTDCQKRVGSLCVLEVK